MVDNGSTDKSVELTRKNFPFIKILELGENFGCPGGRNLGVSACSGEYIFYLDNDGVLHREAVMNAYRTFYRYANVGVVTGTIYDFDSESDIDAGCSIVNNTQYFFNNFQGGICMHRKSIYDRVGLYPSHFMYGSEEYFLSIKLFDAGYNIIKDESVVLWHKRSIVARDRSRELEYGYYNRLYVAITLFPAVSALMFSIYFVPVYFYYSYREGFFYRYLENFPKKFLNTVRRALSDRQPISVKSFKRFRNFRFSANT